MYTKKSAGCSWRASQAKEQRRSDSVFPAIPLKHWEGNAVPWDRKEYSREAAVMTLDVVQFISACLDEDDRE